jgi:N-methylhydantoinase B
MADTPHPSSVPGGPYDGVTFSYTDAFDEGILIPPCKIVEHGELRRDIEAIYLRASRKPYLVALDLRAQITGNNTAKKRLQGLIRRYRPEVVKGVMRKVIDTAETAFL